MQSVLQLRFGAVTSAVPGQSGSNGPPMDRRRFMMAVAATAFVVRPAFARDDFPAHAITIINAFPPGGLNDILTRPLATAMEPILKQPVVVETKAGAAGQVGAQVVASAKPDGYTLLSHNVGISGYAEVDKLFGRPAKVSRAHFIPLARLAADPVLLLVNDQQPYQTLQEFIAGAKAQPQALVFTSGGLYGASHLRWPIWKKRPARCSCAICRPVAAARRSSQCSAIMRRSLHCR